MSHLLPENRSWHAGWLSDGRSDEDKPRYLNYKAAALKWRFSRILYKLGALKTASPLYLLEAIPLLAGKWYLESIYEYFVQFDRTLVAQTAARVEKSQKCKVRVT